MGKLRQEQPQCLEARDSRVSSCEDLPAPAFFVDGTQIHSPVLLKVKKDVSP